MKDTIFKIVTLFWMLVDQCRTWRAQVWQQDLDAYLCCSGHECGCHGETLRDLCCDFQPILRRRPHG